MNESAGGPSLFFRWTSLFPSVFSSPDQTSSVPIVGPHRHDFTAHRHPVSSFSVRAPTGNRGQLSWDFENPVVKCGQG